MKPYSKAHKLNYTFRLRCFNNWCATSPSTSTKQWLLDNPRSNFESCPYWIAAIKEDAERRAKRHWLRAFVEDTDPILFGVVMFSLLFIIHIFETTQFRK